MTRMRAGAAALGRSSGLQTREDETRAVAAVIRHQKRKANMRK